MKVFFSFSLKIEVLAVTMHSFETNLSMLWSNDPQRLWTFFLQMGTCVLSGVEGVGMRIMNLHRINPLVYLP